MSLEVQATNQVKVSQPTVVQTDKTRIYGVWFDFENTTAVASVAFGTGEEENFQARAHELWMLSGTYYQTAISQAPQGSSAAEVLLTAVGGVVATIQSTEGLKDQLLASGELKVSQGSLLEFIK